MLGKTILLPLFIYLFATPASAQECRDYHQLASRVCNENFENDETLALATGDGSHLDAYQKSYSIFKRVDKIHSNCLLAVSNCAQACQNFAVAEEAFAGETLNVKLSQIQTERCQEGGVLFQKEQALEALRVETFKMYVQAQQNFQMSADANSLRQPAQVNQTQTTLYGDQEISQSVPPGLNYNTNPTEFSRQIEEALGYIK